MTLTKTIYYKGIQLDSMEEFYMCHWLEEAQQARLVKDWNIVTESIELLQSVAVPSIQGVTKKLNGLSYTADFNITWEPAAVGILVGEVPRPKGSRKLPYVFHCDHDLKSVIDVKPAFVAARLNSNITFPLMQKILYNQHGIYVQKVIPLDDNNLFHKTYAPTEYFMTPRTRVARKLKIHYKTLNEFLHANSRV